MQDLVADKVFIPVQSHFLANRGVEHLFQIVVKVSKKQF